MKIIINLLLFLLLNIVTTNAQNDIEGSKDHHSVTRYPGSSIVYYEEREYTTYSIPVGPETGYRTISDWIDVEGKFTRIYYELSGNSTVTQLYRNYESAFAKSNFEILAKGVFNQSNRGKEVGGRSWLGIHYIKNPYPTNKNILLGHGTSTAGGTAFIAGKLEKTGSTIYLVIGAIDHSAEKLIYMVDIIEETIMETDLVSVSASEMLKGIDTDGKIALYGIFFDTDKASLKPESESTIKEITTLLNSNPKLNVYIVGHTDMTGGFEHNFSLSEKRAQAVVEELVTKYKITKSRLTAKGVGPLAPVSSNKTEAGKKLNRRVEIVGKL